MNQEENGNIYVWEDLVSNSLIVSTSEDGVYAKYFEKVSEKEEISLLQPSFLFIYCFSFWTHEEFQVFLKLYLNFRKTIFFLLINLFQLSLVYSFLGIPV